MLETIAIISNGLVVVVLGALYRKVNNQEKTLTDHRLTFIKAVANRPDFDQVEKKICTKLKPIKNDLHEVKEKLFDHLLQAK